MGWTMIEEDILVSNSGLHVYPHGRTPEDLHILWVERGQGRSEKEKAESGVASRIKLTGKADLRGPL